MPVLSPEQDQEVRIGTKSFRISGPVRISNITVTPNPVIFGDTNQQGDTAVMSQLIQSSAVGGSGVYKGNPRTDTERSWYSRAETRYRGLLSLPPLAVIMGKPATVVTDLILTYDYHNVQYFAFANKIYPWLDATASWGALDRTLTAVPTDAVVYKDKVYVACGTGIDIRDNAGVWTTDTDDATFLCIWDTKLWKLAPVGGAWEIAWSTDGLAWTAAGLYTSDSAPTQMLVYRDAIGLTVIYLMTETGPWLYDATNSRFLQSDVQIPHVETGHLVRGTVFRDGKLYFTSGGLGMVSLQAGSTTIAAPVGLDQDDGVPAEDSGKFSGIASDFNWLLALIDSSNLGEDDWDWIAMGGPFEGWDWVEQTGPATLRAWQGGWHVLWQSDVVGTPGTVITVSGSYGKRRVYWGQGASVYYIDLPSQVHNPRQNPLVKFARGPVSHVTPWWSYGSEPQYKIHGHFYIRTSHCVALPKIITADSPFARVTVFFGTDLDDGVWTQLGDIIYTNGQHELQVPDAAGRRANYFRFRLDLERGGNNAQSPIVEFWSSEFMRLLPATYSFGVEVDLTSEYQGRQPLDMMHELEELADPAVTPNMIPFAYQDAFTGKPQTYYGKISRFSAEAYASPDTRGQGRVLISFIAPYAQDTLGLVISGPGAGTTDMSHEDSEAV